MLLLLWRICSHQQEAMIPKGLSQPGSCLIHMFLPLSPMPRPSFKSQGLSSYTSVCFEVFVTSKCLQLSLVLRHTLFLLDHQGRHSSPASILQINALSENPPATLYEPASVSRLGGSGLSSCVFRVGLSLKHCSSLGWMSRATKEALHQSCSQCTCNRSHGFPRQVMEGRQRASTSHSFDLERQNQAKAVPEGQC